MSNNLQFWKGYIDAQGKTDQVTDGPIATSRDRKFLQPLADIVDDNVQKFRSGYFVNVENFKVKADRKDPQYIRGWFEATGIVHDNRITITSRNIGEFQTMIKKELGIELPKPMSPSKISKSKRIIVTGPKREQLLEFLNA